jgi:hypothetical protein
MGAKLRGLAILHEILSGLVMTRTMILWRRVLSRALPLALGALVASAPADAQRFLPDDPLFVDHDTIDTPEPPGEIELAGGWDMIQNTFGFGRPSPQPSERAANVNSIDEVPDSSWFTNRIGVREMSLEELARGPNQTGGPDLSSPWVVIRGKSSGITPGFTIRDARGDTYFIKFDPSDYPSLPSAADVIGTKFFHALGYNVPENYIAHFAPHQLTLSPHATISGAGRRNSPMTPVDLDAILGAARPRRDGRYRVVASLAVSGQPIGPHKYFGTRPDDPNDIFPHEDRREHRGYRLFCAWLNHDDSRAINSLDVYVEEDGRHFVRHYLIDFASLMGSGSVGPQGLRAGNEYLLEWGPLLKAAFSLGFWDRAWRTVQYPDYPEVGRFESDFFEPQLWRPEHPILPFEKMRNDDALWAARLISRFSDEAIAAIVATGEYEDTAAEQYIVETLVARRDKITNHYVRLLNPLHGFRALRPASAGMLVFENLGEELGLSRVRHYSYEWSAFDNETGQLTPIGAPQETAVRAIGIPASGTDFLRVRIRTNAGEAAWTKAVDVYLRNPHDGPSVVGIEREN